MTAGCLCCGSEAADRSRREGGLGWQQMAAALVGGDMQTADGYYVYFARYEEPTFFAFFVK